MKIEIDLPEFEESRLAKFPILAFFKYDHLPKHLSEVARHYAHLAFLAAQANSKHPAEVAAGLRKLLEAKDCAVRAALP